MIPPCAVPKLHRVVVWQEDSEVVMILGELLRNDNSVGFQPAVHVTKTNKGWKFAIHLSNELGPCQTVEITDTDIINKDCIHKKKKVEEHYCGTRKQY